jgi:hypothetical protein
MAPKGEDPSTEELRALQKGREQEERQALDESATKDEAHQHRRRADKSAYLREKLEERAESERQAEREDE